MGKTDQTHSPVLFPLNDKIRAMWLFLLHHNYDKNQILFFHPYNAISAVSSEFLKAENGKKLLYSSAGLEIVLSSSHALEVMP